MAFSTFCLVIGALFSPIVHYDFISVTRIVLQVVFVIRFIYFIRSGWTQGRNGQLDQSRDWCWYSFLK